VSCPVLPATYYARALVACYCHAKPTWAFSLSLFSLNVLVLFPSGSRSSDLRSFSFDQYFSDPKLGVLQLIPPHPFFYCSCVIMLRDVLSYLFSFFKHRVVLCYFLFCPSGCSYSSIFFSRLMLPSSRATSLGWPFFLRPASACVLYFFHDRPLEFSSFSLSYPPKHLLFQPKGFVDPRFSPPVLRPPSSFIPQVWLFIFGDSYCSRLPDMFFLLDPVLFLPSLGSTLESLSEVLRPAPLEVAAILSPRGLLFILFVPDPMMPCLALAITLLSKTPAVCPRFSVLLHFPLFYS